jgi:hypothetical protein
MGAWHYPLFRNFLPESWCWIFTSLGISTYNKINEHLFTILRFIEGFVVHFPLAFVHTSFAHLPFWEGTPLQVETGVVTIYLAIWPYTGIIGLFALMNPVFSFVTQPADIECSLHLPVVLRGTAGVSWPSCIVSFWLPAFCYTVPYLTSFQLIVILSRILRDSGDVGPIELSLQLPWMCGIEKGSLHTLFCGFKLDNHLTGLIVEVLLKLVDSV